MSSSRKVSKFRVWCVTENNYQFVWSDARPTCCPTDATHTITDDLTTITDSVANNNVFISAKSYESTNGYYMMEGCKCEIPATASHLITKSYPFPICMFGFNFYSGPEHSGDSLDVMAANNVTVGVLAASAAISATTLVVSPTVTQNMQRGFYVTVTDGTNTDELGMCTGIDVVNNTITVATPLTHAFSPYTTYVNLSIYIVKDFWITQTAKYEIGYGTMAGKPVPTGFPLVIQYNNNNQQAKSFAWSAEYTY